MRLWFLPIFLLALVAGPASAETICTMVLRPANDAPLVESGDCDRPVTPASTFKIPLAVIGFDSGFLEDAEQPKLGFRKGDPDWGAHWKRDTGPSDWMRHSVLWYSQRIAKALGTEKLTAQTAKLGYGNADFSGDAGFDNGLDRAWVSSSLLVTPRQQAQFLARLVQGTLPVSPRAMSQTRAIVERSEVDGWVIHGKTGTAYPRRADRSFDYAKGWGWYVGWAERGGETLVFVRLSQDTRRSEVSPGLRTKDSLLKDWPDLAKGLSR